MFVRGMAHDEAVATQKTRKTASPPKDQPAPYPYPDWSTMQAYYGPGVLPPTYFAPAIAPGHAPQYMWGPQPIMPPPFGTPYAAIYPHSGAYPHSLVPMMSNQSSVEPAKSANSKDKSFNKKLKEIDGNAVSAGSGNSKRTVSSSEDYSAEGSSDVNDQKVCKTPRKRSADDGPETTAAAKMEGVIAPNHTLGNTAILPHHFFPAPVIKPTATNVANSRAMGATISPSPGVMVPAHAGVPTDSSIKDERELKRDKRKQSNRESARRSRLRKQAETEELSTQVESLTAENTSLRSEISRLTDSSEKLRLENSALMVKLKDTAALTPAEPSLDKAATAASSPRAVENFLSMIDSTNTTGVSRHTEHSEPQLRQLLDSSPVTDVVAVT
ncbi:common plant regulatory factor 1-like isoform X2 [Phragmites australis]|uniref:common plant regulatory factor 1-like isoform X2 n=1 Tax=Phragmites australis TaxID=29695 RepID=UPI002D77D662|nr:common plant regulatory factor 1-like isoform X2 [Phragmites australis]